MSYSNEEKFLHESHESENIPETLFTGTNLEYAQRMLNEHGVYRQETTGRKTHLTDKPYVAYSAALNRGMAYNATPVLLIVDSKTPQIRVEKSKRIGFQDDYLADEIPENAIKGAYKVKATDASKFALMDNPIRELNEQFEKVQLCTSKDK